MMKWKFVIHWIKEQHKVDMNYYFIANLNPKFRSKDCSVRVLAIANAKLGKNYDIEKITDPIINDLYKLRSIQFIYDTEIITFLAKLVILCAGDTLGQQYLGGFKESKQFYLRRKNYYCCFCFSFLNLNHIKLD